MGTPSRVYLTGAIDIVRDAIASCQELYIVNEALTPYMILHSNIGLILDCTGAEQTQVQDTNFGDPRNFPDHIA